MGGLRTLYGALLVLFFMCVLISARPLAGRRLPVVTEEERAVEKRSAHEHAARDADQTSNAQLQSELDQLNDDLYSLMSLLSSFSIKSTVSTHISLSPLSAEHSTAHSMPQSTSQMTHSTQLISHTTHEPTHSTTSALMHLPTHLAIPSITPSTTHSTIHSLPRSSTPSTAHSTTHSTAPSTVQPIVHSIAQSTPKRTAQSSTSALESEADNKYVFDPKAGSLVAVYYSQTDHTSVHTLSSLCDDESIDIIILAFLTKFFGAGGWPVLNLGPNCQAASAAQTQAGATGLLDCVSDHFASQITHCQKAGKKVLLSLGGARGYSDTYIPSDAAADEVAKTIWDLFLGGTDNATTNAIRPFGDVVLDGIDLDNESGDPSHLATLLTSLRNLFSSQSDKHKYFISAAPQCPIPDASIPLSSLQTQVDFIMPQFYNNPSCNLDSGKGFLSSVQAWSASIAGDITHFNNTNNGVTSPQLLIGLPTFAGAGTGFVDGETFASVMNDVGGLLLPNVGGAMFWDGSYGEESGAINGAEQSYMQLAKEYLF